VTWLYIPKALSASSLASAPSTSPSDECFQMLATSSTWRTKSRASSDWRKTWKRDASIRRLCGPTFARSQAENSEIASTWWRAAFPARTSATPGKAQDSAAHAPACSSISSQPFATYDRATCSWRTSQHSLFGDSTPFSGRWPKSGLMLGGAVYERPTLARLMAGIGGGASRGTASNWPTMTVSSGNQLAEDPTPGQTGGTTQGGAALRFAGVWPTPNASLMNYDEHPESFRTRSERLEQTGGDSFYVPLGVLAQEVAAGQWPTPSVADTMGGHLSRGGDRSEELLLPGMAQQVTQQWATPTSRDWKDGACEDTNVPTNALLGRQSVRWAPSLSGPLAQPIAGSGRPFSLGGRTLRPQLSALFVEWLMGGPSLLGMTCVCATEGTVSEGLETLSSRNALRRRSGSSGGTHSVSGCEEATA